jgi:fused signal recognition particle receptor
VSENGETGWFGRLRAGLARSSDSLKGRIAGILTKKRLDEDTLEELEDALVMADLGVEPAQHFVRELARGRFGKEVTELEVRETLAELIAADLAPQAQPLPRRSERKPQVVLVCGVNGTGKTTTIGKLAKQAQDNGLDVVLAACDTFRAAAVEQLEVWADRSGVTMLTAAQGADPAGLAYEALQMAREGGSDLLLIDTAGRLQNKQGLMDELRKIVRVVKKLDPEAPHDTVLVLDATTGQNAHSQVETFKSIADISGLIVTKLDGTARAGVVVALARRFKVPIHAIGVGERIADLRPFEARAFARALMGLERAA